MNLTPAGFTEFFRAVYEDEHGNTFDPFPWQQRLAARVASYDNEFHGLWPRCLALPTGSGKTTAVDIAVYALACQTHLPPEQRTAPRRVIFVVDRRVIVDEAFEHSINLAGKLRDALRDGTDGILLDVARALRSLAGGDELRDLLPPEMLSRSKDGKGELLPLTCHQLRGGVYRDDAWARTPLQPCVIASTVDQIGSRLLFRGYGSSFKSRPIHAGLAANDSLIILDEAHCAQPFMETLLAVQKYRDTWAEECVGGPFQFAITSATPPEGTGEPFRIDSDHWGDDRDDEYLGRRIKSRKPTRLTPSKAKGSKAHSELAVELVAQAGRLVSDQRQAIAILVNRVPTAKFCHDLLNAARDSNCKEIDPFNAKTLRDIRKSLPDEFDVVLMTGRMRPADKTTVTETWLRNLSANSSGQRELAKPVIVIATQCLEVGANLDFDGLVSECASFDALRQRFGRLNRTGRDIPAQGVITIRADQVSDTCDDPIYGTTLSATWKLLNERATTDNDCPTIDFGIDPMDALWESLTADQRRKIIPESKHAPIMLPSHLDMWCQTYPEPEPFPDPAVFLRGPEEGRPEVQVCWRSDISDERGQRGRTLERRMIDAISMTPPTSMECLSVPLAVFRRWLAAPTKAERKTSNDELSDVTAGSATTDEAAGRTRHTAVVWRGRESQLVNSVREIRPGETIVLPVAAGGWDEFGHVPPDVNQPCSIDIGDRCYLKSRARVSLRLSPLLVAQWYGIDPLDREGVSTLEEPARQLIGLLQNIDERPVSGDLFDLLKEVAAGDGLMPHAAWLSSAFPADARFRSFQWSKPLKTDGYWQIGLRGKTTVRPRDDAEHDRLELTRGDAFTGDDEVNSSTAPVTIAEHTDGVADFADAFAAHVLPEGYAEVYKLVARLHDLGKADRRFQTLLFGGDPMQASIHAGNPFAKSAGLNDITANFATAWKQSGLPDGFRHEMLSLQLTEAFDLVPKDHPHRDLILHLVATHHGYARPFAPICVDSSTEPLEFHWNKPLVEQHLGIESISEAARSQWTAPHRLDSGVAARFWNLVRHYGWWGLAWLEAIFVLADRRRSEAEQYKSADEILDDAEQKEICL